MTLSDWTREGEQTDHTTPALHPPPNTRLANHTLIMQCNHNHKCSRRTLSIFTMNCSGKHRISLQQTNFNGNNIVTTLPSMFSQNLKGQFRSGWSNHHKRLCSGFTFFRDSHNGEKKCCIFSTITFLVFFESSELKLASRQVSLTSDPTSLAPPPPSQLVRSPGWASGSRHPTGEGSCTWRDPGIFKWQGWKICAF